jgi:peptidoglycan lytic transglycosylase G
MLRRPGYVVVGAVLALLAAFMSALMAYGEFTTLVRAEQPLVIQVRPGETLRHVTRRLGEQGIVGEPALLTLLGILRGDSGNIKAGEYVIQGSISPGELLDYFVAGRARYVSFTVPEGLSLSEIAERLEQRELGRAEVFLALTRDPQFIAGLNLPMQQQPATLEGFLFPETYYFQSGVSEASIVTAMVELFRKRAAVLLHDRAAAVDLTPYQALILASMVEKETAVPEERPLIAAVFHNRLRARMRLASDPTVIYGLPDFDGNLRRVDLLTETPYNTYKIRGLPPTPIANPGLDSIRAAVAPAAVDYLFFVAKGDGTHAFSKDYRTHSQAVWKYQVRPHRKRSS